MFISLRKYPISSYLILYGTLAVAGLLFCWERITAVPPINYYYIDRTGRKVLDGQGFYGDSFKDGLALVCDKFDPQGETNSFRYIDREGKTHLKIKAAEAQPFSDGLAAITFRNKDTRKETTGFIDKDGIWRIKPTSIRRSGSFTYGLALTLYKARIDEGPFPSIEYIDKSGKPVEFLKAETENQRCWPSPFSEGLARIAISFSNQLGENAEKVGFIGTDGKWVIPPNLPSETESFHEGLSVARVYSMGKPVSNYIDRSGKSVFHIPYYGYASSEGLCKFWKNERFGYLDRTGNVVIAPDFSDASDFSEGLTAVTVNGKVGFINKEGKIVIAPQYAFAGDFSEGLSLVVPFISEGNRLKRPLLKLWGEPRGKYADVEHIWSYSNP